MKKLLWLVLLVAFLPKMSQAQYLGFLGPGDTVKIPIVLTNAYANPVAVDSSLDSVFIIIYKDWAANNSGIDTSYTKRMLLDASTNSTLLHTGPAVTFGARACVTFQFLTTAYVLTNSATVSGPYTGLVITRHASDTAFTTSRIAFNYVYSGASTLTYANQIDTLNTIMRWLAKSIMPDSSSAGYLSVNTKAVDTAAIVQSSFTDSALINKKFNTAWHNSAVKWVDSVRIVHLLDSSAIPQNALVDSALINKKFNTAWHNSAVKWVDSVRIVHVLDSSAIPRSAFVDSALTNQKFNTTWHNTAVKNVDSVRIVHLLDSSAIPRTAFVDSALTNQKFNTVWHKTAIQNVDSVRIVHLLDSAAIPRTAIVDSALTAKKHSTAYWAQQAIRSDSSGSVTSLAIWNLPYNTAWTAGSMGDSANNNGFYGPGGGTGLDSATTSRILKRVLYGIATGSGSDSTTLAQRLVSGGSVSLPDSLLQTIRKIYAMYGKLVGDTLVKVKFISPYGDRSNAYTFKGAYTSPNYITAADSNTIFIVGDGKYDTCHVQILARNVSIIGNGAGRTIFRNDSIAYGTSQKDAINVYKPNFYVKGIDFWGFKFSNGDEDSLATHGIRNPWPNPITVYGTAHNFTADGCTFRQCYKGIVTIDSIEAGKCDTARSPLNGKIINNTIRDGQMFGFDVNFDGFDCYGNTIVGIASNIDNGAAAGQVFTGARNSHIHDNFVDSVGIAWAFQNDANSKVGPNHYGYFFSYGARVTNSGSTNFTLYEPELFPGSRDYANLFRDAGVDTFTTNKRTLTGTGWDAPYLSYNVGTGDTFPDARVVSAKFRSAPYSWYANTRTTGTQVTFGLDTFSFWLDTGTYVASAYVYAADGSTTSIKIRDWQQNDGSLLNVTLGSPADSTYQVTTWSAPDTNRWTQVQAKFTHNRLGRVKVQFITHDNSICYWDDFSFTKVSTFQHLTDSVLVDMSSFNNSLDDDSTLVKFLRGAQQQVVSIPLAIPIYGGIFSQYTFAEASARLDSMRYAVYRQMNLPVTGTNLVSPAVVNGIINQAIQTVSTNFPAIEKIDTVIVTISGEGAALNNDFVGIHRVTRILGDTLRVILDTLPPGSQNSQFTTTGGEANMLQNLTSVLSPKYYGIFRKQIQLYPKYMKPTGYTDSLLIEYYANGKYLSVDSMQTDIPASYRDAVWYLTLANLYALRSMYTDAGYWVAQYNALNPKKFLAMPKYEQGAIQR